VAVVGFGWRSSMDSAHVEPIGTPTRAPEAHIKGVSCPHCYDKVDAERRARFMDRQKQVELAQQRGEVHIGDEAGKR